MTYKHLNKYKLKVGLSLTDIGSINYKNGSESLYDITGGVVNEDTFEEQETIEEILENLYTETDTGGSTKWVLPTALHLNVDWAMASKFYLNLNTDLSLTSNTKRNVSRTANNVYLTPRFESKWFSFYMPVGLVQGAGGSTMGGRRL